MKQLILILCLLFAICGCSGTEKSYVQPHHIAKREIEVETTSLFMVGDALLHGAVYHQVKDNNYNFDEMMGSLAKITQNYDLNFYNQETILGGIDLGLSTYPRFNSPQEFGDTMVKYGFNLVSLANNHTLDRNEEAIVSSYDYWQNQEDVMTAGSYISDEHRQQKDIREINGITYSLLSYTYGTNGLVVPSGKDYLVNTYTKEMIEADVKNIRDDVDVLIVSMHWGLEYTHNPTDEQKELAQFLSDLGVDVIVGHHPHVIQPVEWIDDTLVYYSLGNLVSAQDGIQRRVGMMGALEIEKSTSKAGVRTKIKNPKADLLFTYYESNYKNLKCCTFDELDESYQSIYDEYSPIINEFDDSIILGEIY